MSTFGTSTFRLLAVSVVASTLFAFGVYLFAKYLDLATASGQVVIVAISIISFLFLRPSIEGWMSIQIVETAIGEKLPMSTLSHWYVRSVIIVVVADLVPLVLVPPMIGFNNTNGFSTAVLVFYLIWTVCTFMAFPLIVVKVSLFRVFSRSWSITLVSLGAVAVLFVLAGGVVFVRHPEIQGQIMNALWSGEAVTGWAFNFVSIAGYLGEPKWAESVYRESGIQPSIFVLAAQSSVYCLVSVGIKTVICRQLFRANLAKLKAGKQT